MSSRWSICQSAENLNYTWEVRHYGVNEPPARQPSQNDIDLRTQGTKYEDFPAPGPLQLPSVTKPITQMRITVSFSALSFINK